LKNNNPSRKNILFLKKIEKRLSGARILPARYEAETLVRHFSGMNRLDLFAGGKPLEASAKSRIHQALRRRLEGQPLAYLLKEVEFFGRRFFVTKDTLIPRPETELLVEEALKVLDVHYSLDRHAPSALAMAATQPRVLDIGTGCGCIAASLTLERPGCRMTALELSSRAAKIARKNIRYHHLDEKIELVQGDLFRGFGEGKKAFWDMIISNPPYVVREDFKKLPKEVLAEPRLALDGGAGGFATLDKILDEAPAFLKPGGWLLLEIGAGQSVVLRKKMARQTVFKNIRFVKDHSRINRILVAQAWTS